MRIPMFNNYFANASKGLLMMSLLLPLGLLAQTGPRVKSNFDFDWKFTLDEQIEASAPDFDDSGWESLHLPHDWSIQLPLNVENGGSMGFLPGGVGWYRKTFTLPEQYIGKKIYIHFDGVYHQSDVYLNGEHLGFHPYGYTGFEYDLTPYLNEDGPNTLAVKVDHSNSPSSRWYSGSGIYRHVWLKVLNPVHVATWGTYITTPEISDEKAQVRIATTVVNEAESEADLTVLNRIVNAEGEQIASTSSPLTLSGGDSGEIEQTLTVRAPRRWDIDDPYLYQMETIVKAGRKEVDRYVSTFGIREIEFDRDRGFLLNGQQVKLKGVNLHPDAGALGTAVPDRSYLRRLKILKEFGCNAIRCSHNPPSPEFLDMCDSLGFVVIDEAFDKWKSVGAPWGYYADYFDEWWQSDIDAMVLRDRNHPSIILWSVGNETSEQNETTGEGVARAQMLKDYVSQLEPTRPVTVAIAPGNLANRRYHRNGFTEVFDIVGYNYSEPMLAEYHEQFPNSIMYVAEAFPYYNGRRNFVRDYAPINPWYTVAEHDYLLGQFIWAGVDYLGETSGWPSTGWPTGLFDACMFEKPRAAFHRSVWNEEPMLRIAVADQSLDIDPGKDHWSWPHLAAHWTFPQYEGHIIEVQTTTNCDSVSLWVNDKWMGKRATSDYTNNTIVWYVPYAVGKVYAKGYNGDQKVASFELRTAGAPASIRLTPDRSLIDADGQDLSHVTIEVVDEDGVVVPHVHRHLTVEVSGAGELKALDNGDLRKEDSFGGNTLPPYFGKALATVQSLRTPGEIQVRVKCPGLSDAVLTLRSE